MRKKNIFCYSRAKIINGKKTVLPQAYCNCTMQLSRPALDFEAQHFFDHLRVAQFSELLYLLLVASGNRHCDSRWLQGLPRTSARQFSFLHLASEQHQPKFYKCLTITIVTIILHVLDIFKSDGLPEYSFHLQFRWKIFVY